MSDPQHADEPRPLEPVSDVDREEKIEQILLAGLEHYFVSEYEQAINIWTRALFFDRGHARARAYIERARGAQAERQRESEELLQRGVEAFHQGAADDARRLLKQAMDQGAPPEEALAILERMKRLEQVAPPVSPVVPHAVAPESAREPVTSRGAWFVLAALGIVIVAAGAFAAGAFRADLAPLLTRPNAAPLSAGRVAPEEGPSLPRRGENALARARALVQSGRLREALSALDGVRATDAQKADADRLRADVQKQLIGMAAVSPVVQEPQRNTAEP